MSDDTSDDTMSDDDDSGDDYRAMYDMAEEGDFERLIRAFDEEGRDPADEDERDEGVSDLKWLMYCLI